MALYSITPSLVSATVAGVKIPAILLTIKFGEQAQNCAIVKEVEALMKGLKQDETFRGRLVLLNGPASLPLAVTFGHHLGHLFGAVGCMDPKHPDPADGERPAGGYVIGIAHGGEINVGDFISALDVTPEG